MFSGGGEKGENLSSTQDQAAELEELDLGDGDAADGMDTGNGLV